MKVVDVAEARGDLERLLAAVEAGEEIAIQRHGVTVARLSAPLPEAERIRRTPGILRQYAPWKDFVYDPAIFAPLMTDDDLRAEGYET